MPTTKLQNFTIHYHNQEEFHELKNEIFIQRIYDLNIESENLWVIDAGAHIGLSTVYFKKMFPQAKIIAIEPHPVNYQLLEQNIWENNLNNVETYQVALAQTAGQAEFHADTEFDWFSTASLHPHAWSGEQQTENITVTTQTLSFFLNKIKAETKNPFIFLKLDIEGMEQKVLMSLHDQVSQIQSMMIEFHTHPSQKLAQLQKFLEDHQFQLTFWKKGKQIHFQQAKGLFLIEAHHV